MTRDGADDASAVAAWSPPVAIWRNVRADGVRSVRVGVQTSVLALGTLAIYACLPGHGVVAMRGFIPLLASAIVAVVAVRLLPWERMFRTSLGLFMMYVWSTVDILLISVAIVFTGGGRSELWVLYALTTLFFAALYPPRVQAALLAFSEA